MSQRTFVTERLRLEPFHVSDVGAFHLIWGDPEVIWWGATADREESAARLAALVARCETMPAGMGWWWLVRKADGAVVGDVNLQPAPDPPGGNEIGWHLARTEWGKGYATEGAAPLLPHAWSLGLEEVVATIIPVNSPSVGVAERLGMRREGPTIPRAGLAHGVWVARRD